MFQYHLFFKKTVVGFDSGMSRKQIIYAVAILLVSHFLLIVLTFRDYGMCWDQPGLHHYGQAVVRFYTSLGRDDAVQHDDLRLYGGLFEIVASAVQSLSHLGWLEAHNLTSALLGLLGIWAVFRVGEIAFGPIVGVTAALFLTLTPTYYGHEFINPKDIPFAALYSLSLYYIVKTGLDFPSWHWSTSVKAGLTIGATLGVRAGGLILFPLLIGTLFASLLWNVKRNTVWSRLRNLSTRGTIHLMTILILAWSVMLLSWPFAWKPHRWIPFLKAPFVALAEFSNYPWNSSVFFEGRLVRWNELPRNYLITLFVNGLPEFILAGWLLGLVAFAWLCYRRQIAWKLDSLAGSVLFVAGAGPLTVIIAKHAPLYDNFRHVLFTVPPLTILAAAGVWAFLKTFQNKIIQLVCVTACTMAILWTIGDMWALHPYEYTCFNRLVAGGMVQANRRFEMEYWGTSFREAAIWLKQNYRPAAQREVIYDSNALREMTDYFMQEPPVEGMKFRFPAAGEKVMVYLFFRRGSQLTSPSFGHIIHTIEREGVQFLDIVEL
jgi:hypothetical protein